ncbi:SNF1-related protein kinase regulatory subunit beta-2 isoform X1 [Amborella trichopoda]|uniref:Association with the SNF1 complex (ASC) domain-containing protein n=1 Tax=Amborella trichopoda TaxID=13333 RepID=U5D8K6_AMBTC|nr:SNF1-related protein kinase regulatory subunit beta-2 isoform X1 [Amborella trichopoda]XP_011627797.1 SNF1-related protein kinase regulatory subunit beta-2 isoform X1 [Amborella trichopoda]ERN17762.1 hypothetical protein AMTR_s00047p00105560 [Amborella trichopoda]|eukprot:XP_006856295.1 SNF1-related protein kinase regulatory subunit beta-2 isoform X1 [Amborella trichopoda]
MGNANVREDGAEPSGDDEDGQQGQNNEGLDIDSHSEQLDSSEMMGQTPPDSPRAARSPLMFTPQVPMVPLHRPDDMHSPNSAWPYNNPEYEDTPCENGIPYVITWCYGGREVAVEGSWDNWKSRKPMQRTGKDFNIMKVLPSGVYHYRFIVDGQRRYVPDLPWAYDDKGVAHNILDLQDSVPEDVESIAGFEPPLSPDSSYNNLLPGAEDYAKEPPGAPPHLHLTLLNVQAPMNRPQHVVLNHLYVHKGKTNQSVVALGVTHRFISKYVTMVLYKSLST